MSARTELAEYLYDQSQWREQKAQDYPDDDRNLRSATALADLAQWVSSLDDSDPRLLRLTEVTSNRELEVFACLGEDGRRLISRHGFDRNHRMAPDDWLTEFVEVFVSEDEASDLDELSGSLGDGDLEWMSETHPLVPHTVLAERVQRAAETISQLVGALAATTEADITPADRKWLWLADEHLNVVLDQR